MGIRTVLLFVLSIAGILFFAGCGQGMDESDGFNVTHEEFYIMLSEKGKEKGIKLSKQNAGNSVLTREKMCQLISEYIENTPYLKNKYIPRKYWWKGEKSPPFSKVVSGQGSCRSKRQRR